jgi:hypothetical protein
MGGVHYTFSTNTTDADPGNGTIRYDSGSIGSVTFIYIDNNDTNSNVQTTWYDTWDDSTNPSQKGYLTIQGTSGGSTIVNVWSITGTVTVAAGYYKIPVINLSGSIPANGDKIAVSFSRTGNIGSPGAQGAQGSPGAQGVQGASGPSNILDATAVTTDATFYPVFVAGTGNQTPSIRTAATAFSFNPSSGTITIGGDVNSVSDKNIKENIERLQNSLSNIQEINGVKFNWKECGLVSVGVIAQEVEKVLPELVSQEGENKTVKYNGLIAVVIEAIKEQQEQINVMKEEIETLKITGAKEAQ